jgi:metal-dependent amidase/aminoacylase/carboxypeptidase family protein
MKQFDEKLDSIKDELINIRKDFHRKPELGFQEFQTASKVSGYMKNLGLEVTTGIGGTGVIGILRGKNAGPTIALRACLDALAIEEQSGVSYSSENSGVMHACGHEIYFPAIGGKHGWCSRDHQGRRAKRPRCRCDHHTA